MDLRQLQAFLAVVEHGGFTAAARATHTVQSNISTHVARLERELDVVLIDRATGRTTHEGEAVLARARRIQSELESLEADVHSMHGSPRGTVRLGVIGTTARWLVPLLVDRIALETPDIHLVVSDGTTTSLLSRMLDGELDLSLVGLPVDEPEIRTIDLFFEDHVVIAPTSHPLASLDHVIQLEEVASFPLLLAAPGTPFRRDIDDAFLERNLVLRPQLEVDGLRLLASLAFQGFGVAIVPASAAPGWIGGDWKRLQVEGLPRRRAGLAIRKRGMLSAAAQATVDTITAIVSVEAQANKGLHLPSLPLPHDHTSPI